MAQPTCSFLIFGLQALRFRFPAWRFISYNAVLPNQIRMGREFQALFCPEEINPSFPSSLYTLFAPVKWDRLVWSTRRELPWRHILLEVSRVFPFCSGFIFPVKCRRFLHNGAPICKLAVGRSRSRRGGGFRRLFPTRFSFEKLLKPLEMYKNTTFLNCYSLVTIDFLTKYTNQILILFFNTTIFSAILLFFLVIARCNPTNICVFLL